MKILALGDVVGEQTLRYLAEKLAEQRRLLGADLVIANGENVCDIKGISPAAAEYLIGHGVDILTSGNHVFDRRDIYDYLDTSKHLLRPLNYPAECPGEGSCVVTSADGWKVLVLNVSGTAFMESLNNPFASVERALDAARGKYDVAVLDIHAEATSEKLALARYFDGRIGVIFGTHTHVQTADEQILPNGAGYITDLGMTGPIDGILGVRAEEIVFKSRTHLPRRFSVASGEIKAHGALFDVDAVTGRTKSVKRIVF
ncbi:MAG: YmdB family metallophosphoesterase [Ruminococcaceae bacterium]|nr:YmdB family metallophosphoesterase [Oscillospiraceae bacterium]